MTSELYLVWGVVTGILVFSIMMFLNLFWVKYYIRTGEVCDGIISLCEFKSGNFCWSPDVSDLVIFTFFRTFFGFIISVGIGLTWIVSSWFFIFLLFSWVKNELPKGYTFHRRRK